MDLGQRHGWENKGTAAWKELPEAGRSSFEKAREQETAETHLKILKNRGDELVNIAKAIQTETED